jgi:uncharacterized protein Yka (UPF0111/DUF47 family)
MVRRLPKLLRRKRPDFVGRLIQQAEHTLEGMDMLLAYMQTHDHESAQAVRRAEKDADEERRLLIDELNRTFVTPIDREDIFALSRAIDDVLDYAYSTVNEMEVLEVRTNPYLIRMASLLRDAAEEIRLAMHRLEDHPAVASDHAVRAKAIENRMERVYREAIADLFKGPRDFDHIMEMLKLREIYRHMSNAADRGDEAANIITDIVVKAV